MMHRNINANQQYTTWTISTPHLVAVVNEAIALEREACAQLFENMTDEQWSCLTQSEGVEAIRARSNT
jgi:hypothetical protein